ncbi:zinc-binding protein A33-like [Conger conger]|uniref:zinc-binding protein A33-like n=1 Tax=Conger conger TaxID=82655 RepID=UPI002A59D7DA|nr:zinc-binding protein A33-like [Conger conger]
MEAKAMIPEDDLCCSVCCDIFKEPVVLKCSHSFCRVCLQQCWEEKSSRECPICRRKASREEPPLSLALKNIVESYLKQKTERETADKTEARCSLHGEKLVLFCEHDKELLCFICQTSRKHRNHAVCPVEEAALELKEELKPALNLVKEKLKKFTEVEQGYKKTAEHIRSQAQHTERQIKEQKSRIMEEKQEHISGDISTLTDKITAIEMAMETEDTSFLKDPELLSGALIDVAKHLGNLTFRVWEKMLGMVQYTPVTMDPNTAHANLSLSDDLTTVRDTDTAQNCPDNPERFNPSVCVLGSEGLTSGKHSWEVKVGNKREWDVGVVKESINRMEELTYSPGKGYWVIALRNGDEYSAPGATDLTLERKPQSIRVQLDYDGGEVSFFNSSDMSLIYTFKHTFTERLFPFFSPCLRDDSRNDEPLKICPVKVSVTVTSSQ